MNDKPERKVRRVNKTHRYLNKFKFTGKKRLSDSIPKRADHFAQIQPNHF